MTVVGSLSLRLFLDYGRLPYLPLAIREGNTNGSCDCHRHFSSWLNSDRSFSVGKLLTKAPTERLLSVFFSACAAAFLLIPLLPSVWSSAVAAFVFKLANGLISPSEKNLLVRGTPRAMKGGVVAFDRVVQQVAKARPPSALGLLIVVSDTETVFWVLSGLSFMGAVVLIYPSSNR